MEYIYSALVLHSAGQEISEDAVSNVLQAAGVQPDSARVKALVSSLSEIDIEDALATPIAAGPAAGAPAAEAAAEEAEAEEEAEEEEVSEEEAAEGLGALFG